MPDVDAVVDLAAVTVARGGARLVADIEHATSAAALKRTVHTLKGNCGLFGLDRVVNTCHALEDAIEENEPLLIAKLKLELCALWRDLEKRIDALVGETAQAGVEITVEEHRQLIELVLGDASKDEVAARIAALAHEAGFADHSHMTRELRRRYGCAPSHLRAVARRGAR